MLSHKSDLKWGMNNLSKVLALALLLVVSLHILTWNGRRDLMQLPCPTEFTNSINQQLPVLPTKPEAARLEAAPATPPPNSYFPDSDSDIWYCSEHRVEVSSYTDWLTGNFTDSQSLCAAHRQSKLPLPSGPPRIAFLFLTRGRIPLEPVWRQFFSGHESKFSIYVHLSDADYTFPTGSLFHNRTIPSKPIQKDETSLPDAVRRLLAFALLDATVPNAWFHVACDASVPIRGFDYVYQYITNSNQSFVEAFYPTSLWWRSNWRENSTMVVPDKFMRKGEFWVTLHRRHAGLVVGDQYVFPRFQHNWFRWGFSSEVYIPTLMALADPEGIAHHSLVHVNWLDHTEGSSSPVTYNHTMVTPAAIREMQNFTANEKGFYQFDKKWDDDRERSCVYNGVPESPCFLFSRKFVQDERVAASLLELAPVLGY